MGSQAASGVLQYDPTTAQQQHKFMLHPAYSGASASGALHAASNPLDSGHTHQSMTGSLARASSVNSPYVWVDQHHAVNSQPYKVLQADSMLTGQSLRRSNMWPASSGRLTEDGSMMRTTSWASSTDTSSSCLVTDQRVRPYSPWPMAVAPHSALTSSSVAMRSNSMPVPMGVDISKPTVMRSLTGAIAVAANHQQDWGTGYCQITPPQATIMQQQQQQATAYPKAIAYGGQQCAMPMVSDYPRSTVLLPCSRNMCTSHFAPAPALQRMVSPMSPLQLVTPASLVTTDQPLMMSDQPLMTSDQLLMTQVPHRQTPFAAAASPFAAQAGTMQVAYDMQQGMSVDAISRTLSTPW